MQRRSSFNCAQIIVSFVQEFVTEDLFVEVILRLCDQNTGSLLITFFVNFEINIWHFLFLDGDNFIVC